MAGPEHLDERAFAARLHRLEQLGDDRAVRRRIAQAAAVDLAGNVIPRHAYRLECGHIEQVHGVPLPTSTRTLYCGKPGCQRHRPVVEHLTGR